MGWGRWNRQQTHRPAGRAGTVPSPCRPSPAAGSWGCRWSRCLRLRSRSRWAAPPPPPRAPLRSWPVSAGRFRASAVSAPAKRQPGQEAAIKSPPPPRGSSPGDTTHPEDLHVFIDLSLQEGNFFVSFRVSAGVMEGKGDELCKW